MKQNEAAATTVPGVGRWWTVSTGPRSPGAQLAVMLVSGLLVLMQVYLGITLAPAVDEALSTTAAAPALVTAFGVAYAAGFLLFGPLADHYGRTAVLVPGMAGLAITTAAVALSPSLPVLAALRAGQGLAAATFAATALTYVIESLPPRWRSASVGLLNTAFLAAGVLGQVYASAVAQAWDWRWAFALAAAGFAVAVPAMALVLGEPARDVTDSDLTGRYRQLAVMALRRDLVPLYAATGTVLLAFVAMYSLLGPWLTSQFGLDGGAVLLVRAAGLPAMLVAPLAGLLVTRVGARPVVVGGFGLAAAGLGAEALGSDHLPTLTVASALFVAGVAAVAPGMVALVSARAGTDRASAVALYAFALFIGASLAPFATATGLGFTTSLLTLAGLLTAAAALVLIGGALRRQLTG